MKTSELIGPALDWATAIAKGIPTSDISISGKHKYTTLFRRNRDEDGELDGSITTGPELCFSTKWEAGGPIIERENISTHYDTRAKDWVGYKRQQDNQHYGSTPLIAAMRCYVASKLGDKVEIPEKLK